MADNWQVWLRHHRVELNAMTTPQFIVWLDSKMAAFGNGKLVPPGSVLATDLSETVEHLLQRRITQQILRNARISEQVAAALRQVELPAAKDLCAEVNRALLDHPAASWRAAIAPIADRLLATLGGSQERCP